MCLPVGPKAVVAGVDIVEVSTVPGACLDSSFEVDVII